METKTYPDSYKDLPVIHVYSSARLFGSRRLIIAGLFFIPFCIYCLPLFVYSNSYSFFPSDFWWRVLTIINMVPLISSTAGFFIFIFSPNARKKTGRFLSITSILSLEIWHYFVFRNGAWYKEFFSGGIAYWLVFFAFILITILCWERRGKEI